MHARARALWLLPLVSVLGCAQKKSAPASAAAAEPSNAPGASAGAPPMVGARGPAFAPDEIWIHRTVHLGTAATLTVATLARDRTHATLVIETRTAAGTANKEAADLAWETGELHRFAGAITADSGGRFEARMSEADSPVERIVTCTKTQRAVAAAGSTLVAEPKPKAKPGCGDNAVWKPGGKSATVEVLACGTDRAPDDYARSPGLETIEIQQDCGMQGANERLIPEDSAFAPTR